MAEALTQPVAAPGTTRSCDVVVPVYNGHDDLLRCLASLERHTPDRFRVLLVDDASPDPRIAPILAAFAARRPNTRLVSRPRNGGFVAAANEGIAACGGDVVLLNADTIVTAGWLEGLLRCRDSDPRIGLACPLSNNATLLSIPGVASLFERDAPDEIAAAVAATVSPRYPRLPTAVGFCMLATRPLLDAAGPLDAAFGRGYGEENDLSMRALRKGFEIAACDDAYVHHGGEASFGAVAGIADARERNRRLLERRWPEYATGVSAWMRANPLRATFERIAAACERRRFPGLLRVLHVVHAFDSTGGIESHTRAIIEALRGDVLANVAVARGPAGAWTDFTQERLAPHLRVSRLNPRLLQPGVQVLEFAASLSDPGVERAFAALLEGGYDVVHIHSPLAWNTMRLPQIARASGARVILSVHDMAWMCADYNMNTGPRDLPCGRRAARGTDAGCVACLQSKSRSPAGPVAGIEHYIEDRFEAARTAIAAADVLLCPSRYAAARVAAAFGAEAVAKTRVRGHGVSALPRLARFPLRDVMSVAFVGRVSPRKGAHLFIEAARRLQGEPFVFEAWGPIDERLRPAAAAASVALRGKYTPATYPDALRAVHLAMVPSTLEETFCLTLSELQSMGVPVAATRAGAMPERIREGETGFLLPSGDVEAMVALLRRLRAEPAALERVAAALARERPVTIEQNAAEYLALYRELAQAPRPAVSPRAESAPAIARLLPVAPSQRRADLGTEAYASWRRGESPGGDGTPAAEFAWHRWEGGDAEGELLRFNRALASTDAAWIVVADEGDRIASHAAVALRHAIETHPRAALVFSDHDACSERGERYDPAFKPGFDPGLVDHPAWLAGLVALRRDRLLEAGGMRAAGWAGLVEYARRLATREDPALFAQARDVLAHRSDVHAAPERRLPPPRRIAPPGPIALFVRCDGDARRAARALDAIVPGAVPWLGEIFVDAADAAVEAFAAEMLARGSPALVRGLATRDGEALGEIFHAARSEWIAIVDADCRDFAPGWLEALHGAIDGPLTAAVAPALALDGGRSRSGTRVIGGGPWSVAGDMPAPWADDALSSIYGAPRRVAALAPEFSLWRRTDAVAAVRAGEWRAAGRFAIAHLGLALRERGFALRSLPWAAARWGRSPLPPRASRAEAHVPADVAWMRERWGARLADDPAFHPGLALRAPALQPAPRFTPARGERRLAICAYPFDDWGSGHLRVRQPCAALEREGLAEVAMMGTHTVAPLNGLEWARLGATTLLAHNFFHDEQLVALDEYARRGNALRVLGMDDLLTHIPAGNPYAATIYPDIAQRIARAVARCDRLVVSSEELANAYGAGIEVHVIPNAIDPGRWGGIANAPREGPRPRFGWAGARQHHDDLAAIEPLLRETHREIDWVFLGMCPPALRPYAREVHEMVPIHDYPAALASLGLDAAIAPLVDHPFNRAKSGLKALEYGMLGLPVIASDLPPYRGLPVTRVRDDGEWIEASRALARDPERRRREGEILRRWVLTNAMLPAILSLWRRALHREG